MEHRKITVVSTQTQKKTVIDTDAETLGDLKVALDGAGICYRDMTFYEGTSRTEITDDKALLPREVPYKGTTTNELVFMLTNSNKKIRSGSRSREELYEEIQKGKMQNEIKVRFGKNYTLCTNRDLELFLLAKENTPKAEINTTPTDAVKTVVENKPVEPNKDIEVVKTALNILTKALYRNGDISNDTAGTVFKLLNKGIIYKEDGEPSPYSDTDIEAMFDFVGL